MFLCLHVVLRLGSPVGHLDPGAPGDKPQASRNSFKGREEQIADIAFQQSLPGAVVSSDFIHIFIRVNISL